MAWSVEPKVYYALFATNYYSRDFDQEVKERGTEHMEQCLEFTRRLDRDKDTNEQMKAQLSCEQAFGFSDLAAIALYIKRKSYLVLLGFILLPYILIPVINRIDELIPEESKFAKKIRAAFKESNDPK